MKAELDAAGKKSEQTREDRYGTYLGRTYMPELDGLRALSALLVVSVHMGDTVWGWLNGSEGVTVFFVLSGYLITRLALVEERTTGGLNKAAFFVRRSMRLFPLYYFVLLVYWILIFGLAAGSKWRGLMVEALPYHLTYMQDVFAFLVDERAWTGPYVQSWTLGVEEKFYLLWPFLGFWIWRGSPRRRVLGSVCLMVVSMTAPAWAGSAMGGLLHPYSQILIGCLVAMALDDPRWFARFEPLGRPALGWAVLGAFLAFHFAMPWLDLGPYRLAKTIYAIASAALLTTLLLGDGPIQWSLRRPGLVLIGRLSYGLYLVHMLACNVAQKVFPVGANNPAVAVGALILAWVISVAAAWVLHHAIEIHGIRLGRKWSAALKDAVRDERPVEPSGDRRFATP